LNDDLNTPEALSILWQLVDSHESTSAKAESLLKFDQVLGLNLQSFIGKSVEIPVEVQHLLDMRAMARSEKNYAESDRLRTEIEKLGFIVEDKSDGQKVREM
jgi:cysteinyl-tRNA synthetase